MEVKIGISEKIAEPFVLYCGEAYAVNARSRKMIQVLEIKYFLTITGVRLSDKVRNNRIRELYGNRRSLLGRAEQGVLKSSGDNRRGKNDSKNL